MNNNVIDLTFEDSEPEESVRQPRLSEHATATVTAVISLPKIARKTLLASEQVSAPVASPRRKQYSRLCGTTADEAIDVDGVSAVNDGDTTTRRQRVRKQPDRFLNSSDRAEDNEAQPPPPLKKVARRPTRRRCGKCANCLKQDCGKCSACERKRWGPSGGACRMKPCLDLQPVVFAPQSHPKKGDKVYAMWRDNQQYYWGIVTKKFKVHTAWLYNVHFDDDTKRHRVPRDEIRSVDEFLVDFGEAYFKATSGMDPKTYRENARMGDEAGQKMPARQVQNVEDPLDGDTMDRQSIVWSEQRRQLLSHRLLGKLIIREWLDASCTIRRLVGMVRRCWKDVEGVPILVEVEYTEESLDRAKTLTPGWAIEKRELLAENMAFGCRQTAEKEKDLLLSVKRDISKWIVPEQVQDYATFLPKRRLVVMEKNVIIDLSARNSNIPGAGLGVFAKVSPLSHVDSGQEHSFILKNGEMIDLGIYGPLQLEDLRDHSSFVVKSFVFDGKPEDWVYGQSDTNNHYSFDITDSISGELHTKARVNVLVYVNETDGKESPTVVAQRDPFSHVHYLLGSGHGMNQVTLPFGQWIELLIDYGSDYEARRISKGYSRVPEHQRNSIEDHDSTTLLDIVEWTACEVEESFAFLAGLPMDRMEPRARARAFLIALCLFVRLVRMKSNVEMRNRIPDSGAFVHGLLDKVSDGELRDVFDNLRKKFTHGDPIQNALDFEDFLHYLIGTQCTTPASALRQAIQNTLGSKGFP